MFLPLNEGWNMNSFGCSEQANGSHRRFDDLPVTRVLVPVDFSAGTIETLRYAREFATKFGAAIEVLHIIPNDNRISRQEPDQPRAGLIRAMRDGAREELKKLVSLLWENEIEATVKVREGIVYEVILREAVAINAALIVMGTGEQSGLFGWFGRNTVRRVIQNSPCPVLVVHANSN
jgi:nucleotide-binding universal stress UspA family protein